MENLIDLFHTVSVSPWRDKYLNEFLCGCVEHQVFICNHPSRLAQVAADINAKLNNGNRRTEGLLFLETFLSQCPDELFCQNAFSWATQALIATEGKRYETNSKKMVPVLPFVVLRHIIELSGQFPTVVKQILPAVSKLLRQLMGYEVQDILADHQSLCALLQCLQSCMKYCSAQCVNYKAAIEKLLIGLTVCTNDAVILEASKCFLLLSLINPNVGIKAPQLIGGGNSYYTFLWNQMLSKLVATMHFALNELYENVPDFKASPLGSEKLDVPPVTDENPVLAIQSRATVYMNLCQYLSSMLTHPLPAAKSIALEEVLGVVCQALAVTCSSLKDQVSAESLALLVCIPQIHIASISVLSSLMACARLSLLAFGPLIIRLIIQCLKWTGVVKDWPSGVRRPYCSLRCSAYSCLSLWLRISATSSCAEEVAEELIGIALGDIVPSREKLTLLNADARKKPHGKRHKRQKLEVAETNLAGKSSNSAPGYRCALGDGSTNADICCAALEVLTYLLYSVGPFLKPNQHKILQEKAVSVLIDIQRNCNNLGGKVIGGRWNGTDLILPYQSDARCRLALYELLLALVLEPHSHKWPPPMGIAVQLFENGFNDPSIEVSTFCLTSKRTVERILHSSAPTLNFPVMSDKQPDFLNSLVNRVRSREGSAHDISTGEEEILIGMRSAKKSFQEVREGVEQRHSSPSQSRSPSPEVITIGDEPAVSTAPLHTPPSTGQPLSANSATQNGGAPEVAPSDDIVLVRRVERLDRSPCIQHVTLSNIPLTTIQSIGVQANCNPLPNQSLISSVASQSDKVLVLKVPIENSDSAESRKDFAQQWKAVGDGMEVECEDLTGESQLVSSDGHVSRVRGSQGNEPVNGCEIMLSKSDDVEVVSVSEDPVVSKKSPVVSREVLELDVDALSEGEEMISCFVDAEPDSE